MKAEDILREALGMVAPHSFLLGERQQVNWIPCSRRLVMSYSVLMAKVSSRRKLSSWDCIFNLEEGTQWIFH